MAMILAELLRSARNIHTKKTVARILYNDDAPIKSDGENVKLPLLF
jgi:hypothetical protein